MSNLPQPNRRLAGLISPLTAMRVLTRAMLLALVFMVGFSAISTVEAQNRARYSTRQRIGDAISEANPFKKATRKVMGWFARKPVGALRAGEHPRMVFAERNPSQRSQRVFRKKPILVAGQAQIDRYLAAVKDDSIEIIFMPHTVGGAHDTGHVAIRVGDRKLDMTTMGTRNQPFNQSREGYGFVFEVGAERVGEIQAAYDALIRSEPRFTMSGTGADNCYSCAGFITKVLDTVASDLGVRTAPGAIGTAKMLAHSDRHVAVTLYGEAASQAKNEAYVFAKIE